MAGCFRLFGASLKLFSQALEKLSIRSLDLSSKFGIDALIGCFLFIFASNQQTGKIF